MMLPWKRSLGRSWPWEITRSTSIRLGFPAGFQLILNTSTAKINVILRSGWLTIRFYFKKFFTIARDTKSKKAVEMLFDDMKNFVDIRPIRHWLQVRVRAHVFICVLALLLKRIFEINYLSGKGTMEPLEEISESKLIKYKVKFSKREDRSQTFPKVTNTTPMQRKYFNDRRHLPLILN